MGRYQDAAGTNPLPGPAPGVGGLRSPRTPCVCRQWCRARLPGPLPPYAACPRHRSGKPAPRYAGWGQAAGRERYVDVLGVIAGSGNESARLLDVGRDQVGVPGRVAVDAQQPLLFGLGEGLRVLSPTAMRRSHRYVVENYQGHDAEATGRSRIALLPHIWKSLGCRQGHPRRESTVSISTNGQTGP